jgi:hypothetical protein
MTTLEVLAERILEMTAGTGAGRRVKMILEMTTGTSTERRIEMIIEAQSGMITWIIGEKAQ